MDCVSSHLLCHWPLRCQSSFTRFGTIALIVVYRDHDGIRNDRPISIIVLRQCHSVLWRTQRKVSDSCRYRGIVTLAVMRRKICRSGFISLLGIVLIPADRHLIIRCVVTVKFRIRCLLWRLSNHMDRSFDYSASGRSLDHSHSVDRPLF